LDDLWRPGQNAKRHDRIGEVPKEIQLRHIRNCLKADPAYGEGVATALGIALAEVG
jgi:hypothetical protein